MRDWVRLSGLLLEQECKKQIPQSYVPASSLCYKYDSAAKTMLLIRGQSPATDK